MEKSEINLFEEEKVLWIGKPEELEFPVPEYAPMIFILTIGTGAGMFTGLLFSQFLIIEGLLVFIFGFIFGYYFLNVFIKLYKKRIRHPIKYLITNKRVIKQVWGYSGEFSSIHSEKSIDLGKIGLFYLSLDEIEKIRIRHHSKEDCTIYFIQKKDSEICPWLYFFVIKKDLKFLNLLDELFLVENID